MPRLDLDPPRGVPALWTDLHHPAALVAALRPVQLSLLGSDCQQRQRLGAVGSADQRPPSLVRSGHPAALGMAPAAQPVRQSNDPRVLLAPLAILFACAHHPCLGLAGGRPYAAVGGKLIRHAPRNLGLACDHKSLTHFGGIYFFREFLRMLRFPKFTCSPAYLSKAQSPIQLIADDPGMGLPSGVLGRLETGSFLSSNGTFQYPTYPRASPIHRHCADFAPRSRGGHYLVAAWGGAWMEE
jgi:hypothetical protein